MDLTEPARNALDLVLLPGDSGARTVMVTSVRFGKYPPEALLGSTRAAMDGFSPGRRPIFTSLYMGIQTPAPFLPPALGFYGRVSGGLTMYMGQAFREATPGQDPFDYQPQIGPRLAPGIELGIGSRNVSPRPGFAFRSEVRVGMERVARAGLKLIRPTVVIGGDVPIRLR